RGPGDRAACLLSTLVAGLLRARAGDTVRSPHGRRRWPCRARAAGGILVSLARDRRGAPAERRRASDPSRERDRAHAGRRGDRRGTLDACADHVPRSARRQRRGATALSPARLPRPRRAARLLRAGAGRDRHGAQAGRDLMAHVDTRVAIGGVSLPNPVIAASGTFGYGLEFGGVVDL